MALIGAKTLARLTNHMKSKDIVTKITKTVQYTKEGGFLLYLEMPADDDSKCEISKVKWFDPIITVEVADSFGQGADAIHILPVPTRSLWDICSQDCKYRFDPKLKERDERRAAAEEKARQDHANNPELYPAPKDSGSGNQLNLSSDKSDVDAVNPLNSIYFTQVTGFFRPDPNLRKGALLDPTSRKRVVGDKKGDEAKELTLKWCKNNCIVVHHESGSGRTLLCQSGGPELANMLFEFLSGNVKEIANNCEFLSRHLRFEREKIQRFIDEASKMLAGG